MTTTVLTMRQSNPNGADPARIVEQGTRLFPRFARQREARRRVESGNVLPLDLMTDPAASRAAIARKYPHLAR